VKDIVETIFEDSTAGADYTPITTNQSVLMDIPLAGISNGTECYVIGIVYEPDIKKIVALNQTEITITTE
jgi:hypothetical protein